MFEIGAGTERDSSGNGVAWWQPVLFGAMAGGMGWGIRGQYGHESGAMVPGLLVCLTLVFLLCPRFTSLQAARAVALGAIAMGIGGSMTYGQTVGLTHDRELVGNWEAFRWGMVGLAIKGGIWIGFAGAFLGIGLGGKRYRPLEMLWCMLALIGAFYIGTALLNSPFDPANKILPPIYFSDHWYWEPELVPLIHKPRRECWGGLLAALITLLVYTRYWRKDSLPLRLGLWGVLAGALGFPLGQSVQAVNQWNPAFFGESFVAPFTSHFNWWNTMETTFGAVMGAVLGLGVWVNRKRIQPVADPEEETYIPVGLEWVILLIHLALMVITDSWDFPGVNDFYEIGVVMVALPMVAIVGGRFWPYFAVFPVVLVPIAAKSVRDVAYRYESTGVVAGWFAYLIIPVALAMAAAFWYAKKGQEGQTGRAFTRGALLFGAWTYFLLNWAFLSFFRPWLYWWGDSSNGLIYTVCVFGLTGLALFAGRREPQASPAPLNPPQ